MSDDEKNNEVEPLPRLWKAHELRAAERPEWIARNRLPRSAVTVLVGDEGIGKSLFWVWTITFITTGRACPQFGIPAREPADVVIVATEDEWASTVRPRLEVAGADLDRVNVICTEDDGSGAPMFPRDNWLIYAMATPPALVVVDAFLDTVPPGLQLRDPQHARRALHPWKELATRTGAGVLLLTHTNRLDAKSARDKYGITSELRKKARMALFAQADDDGALVIGPEKTNITRLVPATRFGISSVQFFPADDDSDGTVPRLDYLGESDKTARDIVAAKFEDEHGGDGDDRSEAAAWLEDYIASKGGVVDSRAAKDAARKEARISEATLKRAAKQLGVTVEQHGFPRRTHWSLSSDQLNGLTGKTRQSECDPTEPTGPDQPKRTDPTVQLAQWDHIESNGPTESRQEDVASLVACIECGNPLSEQRAAVFDDCPPCRRRKAVGA